MIVNYTAKFISYFLLSLFILMKTVNASPDMPTCDSSPLYRGIDFKSWLNGDVPYGDPRFNDTKWEIDFLEVPL